MKLKKNKAYTFEGLSVGARADIVRLAVNNNKGKFMGIRYIKKDGEIREFKGAKIVVADNGNLLITEVNKESQIRSAIPSRVLELRANGGMIKIES